MNAFRIWNRSAVALGAAALLAVPVAPALAQTWAPGEDDALLLELHSGGYKLGEPMRAYQTPTGVCVDLADFIQTLDLPIRLDKKSRRATGWLFAEDQRIVIDRDANTVQTVNANSAIPAGAIIDSPEGWCVDLPRLSAWTGVTLKADLSNQTVQLSSDKDLPFLQAIQRRSRAARLRGPVNADLDLARLPRSETPYRIWRTPSVDVQLDAKWESRTSPQLRFEALASGEALGMTYAARLAGSASSGPETLRLKAYRIDQDGGMLGPLAATQLALGDVETLSGGVTANSAFGRGVFVSNRPLNRPGRFGVTALRGTMPAGWDAELYRNGVLRAFQSDRGDGRYEFSDIELLFGENDFEVVLYGPQGQIKRERSSAPVGIDSIPDGKTWYWAGIVQQGRDLLRFGSAIPDPQTGWRWGVGVERGIDQRTTAGLEYQSLMLDGRRHNYLEATLRRAVGPALVELTGAQQLGAGRALSARAFGKLGQVRFEAHSLWLDGPFTSEIIKPDQKLEYGLRLNSAVTLGSWQLPIDAALRRVQARDGSSMTEWLVRTSLRIARVSLTAELARRQVSGTLANRTPSETRLNLLANTALMGVRLRGDTTFRLDGGRRGFEAVKLFADTPISEAGTLRATYEYRADVQRSAVTAGYVHQFRRFALRSEASWDSTGGIGAGLSLAFSLGPDPVDGGWRLSRERLAQDGQAGVEVFRDDNGDGYRQAGEAAVEGVTIEAGFRHTDAPTDARGRAVIDGLRPYVPVLVSIDTGSLPDPLLQPKGQGMVVVPRPGIAARISLPLAPTGEIEAVLLGPDGEPRAGVPLQLLDQRGLAVRQASSDFDGFVLLDAVPYGTYSLAIPAETATVLGVRPQLGVTVTIDKAHASQRLGRVRLELLPPAPTLAAAP
jgi:hypothetical protein